MPLKSVVAPPLMEEQSFGKLPLLLQFWIAAAACANPALSRSARELATMGLNPRVEAVWLVSLLWQVAILKSFIFIP